LFYPEDYLGPQTNLIAWMEGCRVCDARPIHKSAVGALVILHEPLPIPQEKPGMQARDGIIGVSLKVFLAHAASAQEIPISYSNLDPPKLQNKHRLGL